VPESPSPERSTWVPSLPTMPEDEVAAVPRESAAKALLRSSYQFLNRHPRLKRRARRVLLPPLHLMGWSGVRPSRVTLLHHATAVQALVRSQFRERPESRRDAHQHHHGRASWAVFFLRPSGRVRFASRHGRPRSFVLARTMLAIPRSGSAHVMSLRPVRIGRREHQRPHQGARPAQDQPDRPASRDCAH
jgi:hypothetical protein